MSTLDLVTSGSMGQKTNAAKSGGKGQWNQRWGGFKKPIVKQPKFEGKCEELKGFIYDCSDARQADMFTKTMKEIAGYAGRNYHHSADIRRAIMDLEKPDLP